MGIHGKHAVGRHAARALTQHRNHVTDEDVRAIAHYTFSHRLELAPGAGDPYTLINELIAGPLDKLARRAAS